jgi:hypothetical protein
MTAANNAHTIADHAQIALVTEQMRTFTQPFVAPLSYEPDDSTVRLAGTGNFIEILERRILLTCEHVVLGKPRLAFKPWGTDQFLLAPAMFASVSYPYDVAVTRINNALWGAVTHEARPIQRHQFAFTHAAVQNELLFFKGYAGENAPFAFDTLAAAATSYTTQEIKGAVEGVDGRYFFLLHHRPEDVRFLDEKILFSNPSGFSGAVVWDTGYVNCLIKGESWTPDMARVTGMVCRWATGDPGIIVLRIEHLRSYLLDAIEDPRANGDW